MERLIQFAPETILLLLGAALMLLTLASEKTASAWRAPVTVLGALAAAGAGFATLGAQADLFSGTYRVDAFSQGFKALTGAAFLICAVFCLKTRSIADARKTEACLFMTAGTLGMMMIPSSADLLTLYVSLELSAYSLYLLSALGLDRRSSEAGVKYLLFGAASSGILLWGMSLLAGLSGTTSLAGIAGAAASLSNEPAFLLAAFLVALAALFKLSGFPMQFWAPDVYEAAPLPSAAFIATASKAAAVALFIRLFLLMGMPLGLISILGVLAFISMTLGNCAALVQRDVKRLLAYSSIAQAGYLVVGLLCGNTQGYAAALFYAAAYILMNAGAFLAVVEVSKASGQENPSLKDFDGLAERSPFLALLLLLSLLSLAGIPPLAGFTGKWILFGAAMNQGHWFLVLWGVLNSVVSLFYYLTLVKHAYLEKPAVATPLRVDLWVRSMGLVLILLLIVLGVFPNPLFEFSRQAVTEAFIR